MGCFLLRRKAVSFHCSYYSSYHQILSSPLVSDPSHQIVSTEVKHSFRSLQRKDFQFWKSRQDQEAKYHLLLRVILKRPKWVKTHTCVFSDPHGVKPQLKFGHLGEWEHQKNSYAFVLRGYTHTSHPVKRQEHHKRRTEATFHSTPVLAQPPDREELLNLTASSWTLHSIPLLEIRSHYLQSRTCKEINLRQERIPAFISAIWEIFWPEEQHGVALLQARQSQKQRSYTRKMQVPSHLFCSARGMRAITEVKLLLLAAHMHYKNRYIVLLESVPGAGIYQHTV